MQPLATTVTEDALTDDLGDIPRVLVASAGLHTLWRVTPEYYVLAGPGPHAGLMGTLPPGNWQTEWSGQDEDLLVHIFR